MSLEGIDDPSVLTALHTLVNPETVDVKLDLEDIEKQLIGNTLPQEEEVLDPGEAFKSMMQEFSKNIELDMGGELSTDIFDDEANVESDPFSISQIDEPPKTNFKPEIADMKIGYNHPLRDESRYPVYEPPKQYNMPTELSRMTEERKDQQQIDYVLQKMGSGDNSMSSSFEAEREKEEKIRMLDAIDAIKGEMKHEKIDISSVPPVTIDNSYSEISNTLRILTFKYDRKRYSSLAEDVIMAGAYGAEWVFDGNRKFGPYSPDLTDWHSTVRVKLRRMRFETSTIVSDIMNEYQIGPLWRILLELIPSAFLHSRMRSNRQHGMPTDEEMQQALANIRDFET